ncbi:thiamine pyrophosphate-requiring protein [Citreimonas salinaria]|uniref:Acetolactate synthase-1/2/3 large subunit n=1 Tax=Citreimonas salinaria TaxID=321339 RepID=A0A1H3KW73_9RHOB|nr:thiamine pyrophosphate-requiring protein [Citreimonas salinaria]SDY56229.1 acetolactate synthase-1/2/3 large subunit [Citreimonas salinaria]
MEEGTRHPQNGAESVLLGLKRSGVDWLFANAGTDFPPIIEALAALPADEMPVPVTIPHETATVGMAHGYYLVTGRPQAVMVHVNVGLANAVMGVINAASDNVPVVVMSGRTPLTEAGRAGGRATPIQYGQEMYDQTSLVSDTVKHHYEMRYPEQGEPLVSRGVALAMSAPCGPVYLSLPREPLTEAIPEAARQPVTARPAATRTAPDPAAIETLAGWLREARAPVILCQRGDPEGRLSAALSALGGRMGIGVAEPFMVRNVLPSADPVLLGYDPGAAMDGADLVIALDSDTPWIERLHRPGSDVRIAHMGPDPHFARMPVRGYRTDLAIACDPALGVAALDAALRGEARPDRAQGVAARAERRRKTARATAQAGKTDPMTAEWLSLCLSRVLGDDGIVFGELGVLPGMMDLAGPNRLFCNPHSGGLGWALPAALGAQLARPGKLTVACMGDGSYIFANPVACHQIGEALGLPVLSIIKNNGMWNAVRRSVVTGFPGGAAAQANVMPLTSLEPQPDFCWIAAASRAHVERVSDGAALPAALDRAVRAVRDERRQAVLDVRVALSDSH